MKTAVRSALLLVAMNLAIVTASGPMTRPEDVGLSSERLQRINQMIERRIAAGDIAGAVTIVARKGKVARMAMRWGEAGCSYQRVDDDRNDEGRLAQSWLTQSPVGLNRFAVDGRSTIRA